MLYNKYMENKITNAHLKIIASISMFIDHFGAIFIFQLIQNQNDVFYFEIYSLLRIIGRIAFPIYCFLLIEGFIHTKNVFKYWLRLLLFALISEIPFDLAFNHTIIEFYSNNVFFTLCIGLLTIFVLSKIENIYQYFKDRCNKYLLMIGCILLGVGCILILGNICETYLMSDYGMSGVFCIVCMYLFRSNILVGYILGVLMTVILNQSWLQIYALFGLLFVLMYDGEKGKINKYFFYLFYPLHLLIISGITYLCGIYY